MPKFVADQEDQCQCRCIHQDEVDKARDHALPEADNQKLATIFKVMGDPNRLKILWALAENEMCVCDLAMLVEVSESAVSHQLRQLRQLQLVRNRRAGPILYYSLVDDTIINIIKTALNQQMQEKQV